MTTTAPTETSDAQRGLNIMRKSGEMPGRQFLIDHQHRAVGPETAHRTGTLILEDASLVTITEQHYAFRWTMNEHEFSLTHPTSSETQPWPIHGSTSSLADQACHVLPKVLFETFQQDVADQACHVLLERFEENLREELQLSIRHSDDPVISVDIARTQAADLWPLAVEITAGHTSDRVMTERDRYISICVDELIKSLPTAQYERLERNIRRELEEIQITDDHRAA